MDIIYVHYGNGQKKDDCRRFEVIQGRVQGASMGANSCNLRVLCAFFESNLIF